MIAKLQKPPRSGLAQHRVPKIRKEDERSLITEKTFESPVQPGINDVLISADLCFRRVIKVIGCCINNLDVPYTGQRAAGRYEYIARNK